MPTATSENHAAAPSIVELACRSKLAAEIHYDRNETLCAAQCHLLRIHDGKLLTDGPKSFGEPVVLQADEEITVHLFVDDKHYSFHTKMIGPVMDIDLDDGTQVVGTSMHAPAEVREQPRRQDFRVSLAAQDIRVRARQVPAKDADGDSTEGVRFTGRLTNISTGGLGLFVEAEPGLTLKKRGRLHVEFRLPDEEAPLGFLVEIKHVRTFRKRNRFVLGLKLLPGDGVDTRIPFRRVRNFVAAEQRRQLQNR